MSPPPRSPLELPIRMGVAAAARRGLLYVDQARRQLALRTPWGVTYLGGLGSADSPLFGGIVLPKTAGTGIKVNHTAPDWAWQDLPGPVQVRASGANDPTWAVYDTDIRQYQFSNAQINEAWFVYHIPHDYAPGTDIYIHVHWSQTTVDTGGPGGGPGSAKWSFSTSYAKGHNQAAFLRVAGLSVTQQASSTQRRHMIAETQLSAGTPGAGQIDTDVIEPDGLLLVRMFRDPADAADTLNVAPFVHTVDLHYQSTGVGTKGKAPNFYT